MRSLCGRTVPDGAIGILLAVMMVVFARMPLMWTSVDPMLNPISSYGTHLMALGGVVCWTLHNSPLITRPLSGSNDQRMLCWV